MNKNSKNILLIIIIILFIPIIISCISLTTNLIHKYNGEYIEHYAILSDKKCYKISSDNNSPKTCDLYINYKINNKEYKNIKFNTFKARSQIGEKIEIYYNKNNPEIVTNFDNIPISLLSLIINLTIIIIIVLKNKKGEQKNEQRNRKKN